MHSKSIRELSWLAYPDLNESPCSNVKMQQKQKKYRSKFVFRAMMHYPYFRQFQRGINAPFLQMLLQQDVRFLGKTFRPYLHVGHGIASRTQLVIGHYRFISECLPTQTGLAIYNTTQGIEVSRFTVGEDEYSVTLSYFASNHKEGDLCMKLLDPSGNIFYSITFSVYDDPIKGRTITVGSLQGPKSTPEINDRIKCFTKQHFGQRPKDLMVKILTIIANVWDVKLLLLVTNEGHIYSSKRYADDKLKTNYNGHWESLGATKYSKYLYQLDLLEVRKLPEDVKRSKRAMYRKRYEWLDALMLELGDKLALKVTINSNHNIGTIH
ncbi:DUF535 domain-containing protein [Moritella marina ATCC 15381]|uniref:DUF535 domain-containing protein n=1 Tax=Moritella marina ATCC 15381 TaxID=1202962 RepID=A0A5J6WL41_MORMI|nr:VirK/YbjX family protein [Moritella marina]QFI38717.1 DUF535 domain-containing protein [Moritella marina ATCC 15381]